VTTDLRVYDNEHGDPVVVMVTTGTFDVSRLAGLMWKGRCEDGARARAILRGARRHNGGRAALKLLADHGGPDLLEAPRPPVVCLCGSTRFVDEFNAQRKALTEAGEIVLSIEVVTTQAREDDPQHCDPELKARLDELHKRKIDLADYCLILNIGGYIGESTRSEVAYALEHGKPVTYLEPVGD
jgi:hypothetical protein